MYVAAFYTFRASLRIATPTRGKRRQNYFFSSAFSHRECGVVPAVSAETEIHVYVDHESWIKEGTRVAPSEIVNMALVSVPLRGSAVADVDDDEVKTKMHCR